MIKSILSLMAAVLFAVAAHAQTTYTGTVGLHNCGGVSISCYGIPMVINDGTQLVNESVWIDYNSAANFLVFPEDPLGLDNSNGFGYFTSPLTRMSIAAGTQTLVLAFAGTNGAGESYTGSLKLNYTTYYVSGRGGGWKWVVTGGTVTITY